MQRVEFQPSIFHNLKTIECVIQFMYTTFQLKTYTFVLTGLATEQNCVKSSVFGYRTGFVFFSNLFNSFCNLKKNMSIEFFIIEEKMLKIII